MKCKFIRVFLSMLLAGSLVVGPIPVYAGTTTVTVGTQVRIPTNDLKIGGAMTESQAIKEKQKFIEEQSSNSSVVDSNIDEVIRDHLPSIPTDFDNVGQGQQTTNPTFTLEEFEEIISQLTQEQQNQYEQALQEMQAQQQEQNSEAVEFLRELYEIISSEVTGGIDGNGNTYGDNVYNYLNELFEQMGAGSFEELLEQIREEMQQINHNEENRPVVNDKVNQIEGERNLNQLKDYYIPIDKSAYKDDKINPDARNLGDLYTCAKCGITYGMFCHCNCGKTLNGTAADKMATAESGICAWEFDENGYLVSDYTTKTGAAYADLFGGTSEIEFREDAQGNKIGYSNRLGGTHNRAYLICMFCGRAANKNDIASWISMDTAGSLPGELADSLQMYNRLQGMWSCHDCFYNTGKPDFGDKNMPEAGKYPEGYKPGVGAGGDAAGNPLCWYQATGHLPTTPADVISSNQVIQVVGLEGFYRDPAFEPDTELDPNADKLMDALLDLYENMMNQEFPEAPDFTQEQLDAFTEALDEAYNNGLPSSNYLPEYERVNESSEYTEFEQLVFGEWTADRQHWTERQEELFEEIVNRYENNSVIDGIMDQLENQGIFDPNIDVGDRLDALQDFISQYTSITDKIKTTLVVDYKDGVTNIESEKKTIIGLGKAEVYNNKTGKRVCYIDPWDTALSSVWLASEVGTYTVKRELNVYDCVWKLQKYTAHVKWVADDLDMVLYDKEISRIREDSSGTNDRNIRTVKPADAQVRVIKGNLDLDNQDYFATERID